MNGQREKLKAAAAKAAEAGGATSLERTVSWAALSPSEALVPLETVLAPLGAQDVEIKVRARGLRAACLERCARGRRPTHLRVAHAQHTPIP
jgi:hypothetical protein